jgi:hypothetical protein
MLHNRANSLSPICRIDVRAFASVMVFLDPDGNLFCVVQLPQLDKSFSRESMESDCNNHQVHSWVYSHVKLVFILGYSEPVPLVEMTCGINLNNRQRNSF